MKQSGRIAVGGVFSALALACMLMTIFPYATYALPAMAGVCLIPVVLELGWRWGWMAYAVTALLSPLLAADKEAALLFIAFFGYYPVLKAWIERRKSRVIEWAIKLLLFNAAMVAAYMAAIFVFRLPVDFEIFGVSLPFVLLALGNVTFLIYDKALTGMVSLYLYRLQSKLYLIFKYYSVSEKSLCSCFCTNTVTFQICDGKQMTRKMNTHRSAERPDQPVIT